MPPSASTALRVRFGSVTRRELGGAVSRPSFGEVKATPAELLQHTLQLPADDRLALATELLESVEGPEDPEWAQAWAAELDRRE